MFCTYLELDMDIDVVICCVELEVIVFKFSTCELFDMDNDVFLHDKEEKMWHQRSWIQWLQSGD